MPPDIYGRKFSFIPSNLSQLFGDFFFFSSQIHFVAKKLFQVLHGNLHIFSNMELYAYLRELESH